MALGERLGPRRGELRSRRLPRVALEQALWPFDRATLRDNGLAVTCLNWPATPQPLPEPPDDKDLPDVPVLMVVGDRDLSAPVELARQEEARAPRVEAPRDRRRPFGPDQGPTWRARPSSPSSATADLHRHRLRLRLAPTGPCSSATPTTPLSAFVRPPASRSSSRLPVEPAAVSGERAGCADHTVARHDDGDQVAAVCQTDGAGRTWTAELFGNLAADLAVRDRCQRLPDFELERRPVGCRGRSNSVRSPAKYASS